MEDDERDEPPVEPEPPPIAKAGTLIFWLLGWAMRIGIVLLIVVVGQLLPPLRRIDTALAPHHATLRVVLVVMVAAGYVLFMGGIFWLIFHGKPGDGEFSLRERVRFNTPRMRRFFVILSGVVLMMFAAVGAGIVFGNPGVKLLTMIAVVYLLARMRMAASM